LDTVQEVFATTGKLLGSHLKRFPDGEPGGRRMWINWQYPLLRGSPFLQLDHSRPPAITGCMQLMLADGVKAEDVHFGELGYAREARASYQDFLAARENGQLPRDARFQVCLPTPFAVVAAQVSPAHIPAIEASYEKAMIREAEAVIAAIPHKDLCIQWDICIEMVAFDGRTPYLPSFPHMDKFFGERFGRLTQVIPYTVELGFHLCYGDLDAKHAIEPIDATKLVEMTHLIIASVKHPIAYFHMPVPINRTDDAYFAPLTNLKLPPETELFLGLIHAKDGVIGAKQRMKAAQKYVHNFGIASECGISRARTAETVNEILRVHAAVAETASA
jgi:hypothetical protein